MEGILDRETIYAPRMDYQVREIKDPEKRAQLKEIPISYEGIIPLDNFK